MAIEFGAGIALDEDFDFSVDTTGDLKAEYAIDELEKDLAFKMVINLSQFLGRRPTPTAEAEVANIARRVALADERVSNVPERSVNVSFDESLEQITVTLSVDVGNGAERLIFTI